ncbi:DNA primase TraC [Actinobacillus porcinus]|uniref:DNA primase TraC n=2 Tax=Actinobacillus porcinus TaxID=51048 RepID=A0ABY6TKK9_9PAST|nr:DNA primase TraC [Actinobacillus porcinus]VTU07345.1 DNA primase TraC [Actinobacillus porcinus]
MPTTDQILMPEMKQFESHSKFYSTLLHEMTYATGHAKRLDREGITSGKVKFGNQLYAMEELVAEIVCVFLWAHIGFDDVPQHAVYIDSWLKVLKADKKAIFKATGFARTACDYMFDALNAQKLYENTFISAERIAEVA